MTTYDGIHPVYNVDKGRMKRQIILNRFILFVILYILAFLCCYAWSWLAGFV